MEQLPITVDPERSQFRIDGFPNAAKVVQLHGRLARQMADHALHRTDLMLAKDSLQALGAGQVARSAMQMALWHTAINSFAKCFGGNRARASLQPEIFPAGTPREVYHHFQALRNKHFAHDDNAYSRALPAAIISPPGQTPKVQRIVCPVFTAVVLSQENFDNATLLVDTALVYVNRKLDELAEALDAETEAMDHDALLALPAPEYTAPTAEDAFLTRPQVPRERPNRG
jgi:hypothetical protein